MFELWLKGLLTGLVIALPVGPVGLLCLDMTVSEGRKAGLGCSCGMVAADTLTATVSLIGMGVVSSLLTMHERLMRIICGAVFVVFGLSLLLTRKKTGQLKSRAGLLGIAAGTFLLSLTPATFTLLLMMFTVLHVQTDANAAAVITGVSVGSASWCAFILLVGYRLAGTLGRHIEKFRSVVGACFVLFGLASVLGLGAL